jgi:DNA-binding transcriptional LysR family regulator
MVLHMEFTTRMLEQFVVLTREQHFGRAAAALSMTQPPLSQAIQRLERGLGVDLLQREAHGVSLTAAGAAFAEDAQRLLDAQAAAIDRAHRIAGGVEGTLRLGFVNSQSYSFLPKLLRRVAQRLPGLQLHLRQNNSATLCEMVKTGSLDLAIIRTPVEGLEQLAVHELHREHLVVALPEGHRLAGRASVPLYELADDAFALPNPVVMPTFAEQVRSACLHAGFTPKIGGQADDLQCVLSYTTAGVCVSLLPSQMGMTDTQHVVFRPVEGPARDLESAVVAVHRMDTPDPAVKQVLRIVKDD